MASPSRAPRAAPGGGPAPPDVPRLEGRYVRLEPLRPHHDEFLLDAALGRDAYAYLWVPRTREDMQAYVAALLAEDGQGTSLSLAVVERASRRIIGVMRFPRLEFWRGPRGTEVRPGGPPDAVEAGGSWLARDAQRTGAHTDAALLMLTHAFEAWGVVRVRFSVDARDLRARTAILRLGARFEGVLRAHALAADGTVRDHALFSIVDGEWPAVRARLAARLR